MDCNIVGWDIGGAHLKAAVLNQNGEVLVVYQEPCPLWQGLKSLEIALTHIIEKLPVHTSQHAITMTGELVDLFANKAQGVTEIVAVMQRLLEQKSLVVYAGRLGFISAELIEPGNIDDIASANWLASAQYVAQKIEQGLFIDMGSTTTDILLLRDNQVGVLGYTDFQRLISSELVYTGMVRTAVMAVVQSVEFAGNKVGVMSEYFATMADVYRLTHELNERHDQSDAADNGAKTEQASAQRLARMVGCDEQDFSLSHWQELAYTIRRQQLDRIQLASQKQLSRVEKGTKTQLIGAGVGRFLIQEMAQSLGLEYTDFNSLFKAPLHKTDMQIADCAPAVSVAYLAREKVSMFD
ncbi:MAG: H4MPT-linked C1 transfer pathway protein [Methyloprofundus sp.]|nr:H4MPT-linked C1 transfer pathway protein [Methyloprofundus sp.]